MTCQQHKSVKLGVDSFSTLLNMDITWYGIYFKKGSNCSIDHVKFPRFIKMVPKQMLLSGKSAKI